MWSWPLIAMFALSVIMATSVAWSSWRRRHSVAMRTMALTSSGIAWWSLCDLIVLLASDPRVQMTAKSGVYLGVGAVVMGYYLLTHAVVDRSWRIPRSLVALLLIEPVLVVALVVTNNQHHLFVTGWIHPGPSATLPVVQVYGPLFWLHTAYSYVILLIGSIRTLRALRRAPRALWGLYSTVVISAVTPAVANFLSIIRVIDANLTAIGFTVSVTLCYQILKRRWLVERVPVGAQRIVDTLGDAVLVIDRQGRIITSNPAAEALAARLSVAPEGGLVGRSITIPFGSLPLVSPAGSGISQQTLTDYRGSGLDLQIRVSAVPGRRDLPVGWLIVAQDITELNTRRREAERHSAMLLDQLRTIEALRAELTELAVRDPLTGLYNRRFLMERLQRLGETADPTPVSLAIIDLDHFKRVNDDHGHDVGDLVLTSVARELAAEAGPDDVAVRHGGEEFILLMAATDAEHAWLRADRLRTRVESTPVTVGADSRELSVTFSAGVATATGLFPPKALLRAADDALYVAKRTGRNTVRTATPPFGTAPSGMITDRDEPSDRD